MNKSFKPVKKVYRYRNISIPPDLNFNNDVERLEYAICVADETSRHWHNNCEWTVVADKGTTVKVRCIYYVPI